ncbi:MAG: 8-oxoguanine deaminase [Caldilineaceae bacterium]|nr:8-oxoguanine deaminase [Caldilineaceae bacterium]
MTTRTVLTNADCIVTMNEQREEIADGALVLEGKQIVWVGATTDLPVKYRQGGSADSSTTNYVNAGGKIVLPGFINTHHHFFQTLTRVVPAAQNAVLFDWLRALYPIWSFIGPEDVHASTQVALTELLLSGCTTSSDHHYLWHNGSRLDDQFAAAEGIGVRFHGARGSVSLGESKGGLPPDWMTEEEPDILVESRRLVEEYHDASRFSMRRVVIGPTSPFSVSQDLMRESAALARSFGPEMDVHLHSHLAETVDEEEYCMAKYGYRPGTYAEVVDWLGDDVWHAHCVHLSQDEVNHFASTKTGAAHCPTSNMRLASGISPVRAMRDAGVNVGLGVDGSASNDGSNMLEEVRQCLLLQRVMGNPHGMTAREALEIATLGGASVLGRDDVGALVPGMAADVIGFDLSALTYAGGAVHDPVAALVFCSPQPVDFAFVNGKHLVEDGMPRHIDLPQIIDRHNRAALALLRRAEGG